jgi:hypothetical protein
VSQSSGIILRTVESSFFNAPPKAHPSNVYVVSYNDGRIRAFSGAPSAADRWGSRFCYIVDTAERRVRNSFTAPTCIDAYSFTIEVGATWKVTNPEAVVKANLIDGNEVVLGRLRDELWIVGRQFRPEDASGAEAAARSALLHISDLEEGITLLRSTARFQVDRHLTAAVLERDHDTHQGNRDEQKLLRLRRMVEGNDEGMVLLHLLQHPEDTGTILQMMADARDKNQAVELGLLDRMLEHNLITDADAQPLRDRVLGGPTTSSVTMRPISPRAMPQALPSGQSPTQTQKAYVVEDAPALAQPAKVVPIESDPDPDSRPATGGVKKWKPLKKPDQERE